MFDPWFDSHTNHTFYAAGKSARHINLPFLIAEAFEIFTIESTESDLLCFVLLSTGADYYQLFNIALLPIPINMQKIYRSFTTKVRYWADVNGKFTAAGSLQEHKINIASKNLGIERLPYCHIKRYFSLIS